MPAHNHRHTSIERVVRSLLSGVSTTWFFFSSYEDFIARFPNGGHQSERAYSGSFRLKETGFVIWFLENNEYAALEVTRENPRISKREWKPFSSFRKIAPGLIGTAQSLRGNEYSDLGNNINRLATGYSLGSMLVAHNLTGSVSSQIFTNAVVIDELQRLALTSYEGARCHSGFLFFRAPHQYFDQIEAAGFRVERFEDDFFLEPGFFQSTISHRYVDGRNSFYIIDNNRKLHGIATVRDPGKYSLYSRALFEHIEGIAETNIGRMYCAFVGRNADVVIYAKGKALYRWDKLAWRIIDLDIVLKLLSDETSLSNEDIKSLQSALLVCSDLRYGTLVLVLSGKKTPNYIGKIDNSAVSSHILNVNQNRSISDIVANGSAFGILTSDGLTTLNPHGRLASSGDILDLSVKHEIRYEGGGRTQAAQVASYYGIALKVSEDGPLSIYKDGRLIAHFEI